jgi:acetyl-CoA C-acetyltransferase
VLEAAQDYADRYFISRESQEEFAIESHRKASRVDSYARDLNSRALKRFRPLIRGGQNAITAATVAPEADGAAALVVAGELSAATLSGKVLPVEILDVESVGVGSREPALAGLVAAERLLARLPKKLHERIRSVEIMESFAAQALHHQRLLGFPAEIVNCRGGLLAAGHPIGASGAVLVGNLFWELQSKPKGSLGLACIPAAGGLGSAMLLGN